MFHDILIRKNALLDDRNKKFKKSKNWNFSKQGLVHGFGLKLAIFLFSYFRQNRSGKCVSRYSTKKKRLSRLRKTRSPDSQKIGIFQKRLVHGFGLKFYIFEAKKGEEIVFHVMLERENAFLEYKNEKSKVSKKLFFFLRGYSMILVRNWQFFHLFIFVQKRKEMSFTKKRLFKQQEVEKI